MPVSLPTFRYLCRYKQTKNWTVCTLPIDYNYTVDFFYESIYRQRNTPKVLYFEQRNFNKIIWWNKHDVFHDLYLNDNNSIILIYIFCE